MYQEKKRVHYFPESFRSFIKARSLEILGLSLLCGSGVLFLSLLTYDHTDASMNVISSMEHFSNALGLKGAYIADFLMQYLGKTSYILPICIALWGLLTLAHRSLKDPIKRSLAIIGATILGASSISCFAIFLNINIKHGVIGLSLATKLVTFFETVDFPPLLLIISGVFFLGFLASIFYAISLSLSDWRSVLYILWSGVKKATKSLIWALKKYKSLTSLKPKIYDEIQDETPIFEDDKHLLLDKEFNNEINTEKDIQQSDNSDKTLPHKRINKKENILSLNNDDSYTLPSLSLLQEPNTKNKTLFKKQEIKKNIEDLAKVLTDYGIKGEIIGANPGPVVTLYELKPAPGIKSSRIIGLADDIARSMHAISARIAVVPGKNIIGIELPNEKRQTVYLQDLLGSRDFEDNQSKLTLALGKNICGHPVLTDLARMPHMIVAGTTGSGKSVGINAMILSLLYRHSPETCRLILIDPKMLEFSMYNDIPHLLTPVVTEPKKAIFALKWAVREMENRYRGMSHLGVRNIESYNLTLKQAIEEGREITRTVQTGFDSETGRPVFEEQPINMKPLPYIVVVVDEMADLMMVAGKDIESAVQRLAQMARAAGIHVIMATQRPSVDVITGTIKANFPTRISFQVTSKFDSRTILGEQGAEQLLGRGDMLFMEAGGRIQRIHGPFVSDEEVERIVSFLKKQGSPDYISNVCDEDTSDLGMAALGSAGSDENNELYMKAVSIVKKERKASTSFIQRRLQIGYNRAARIIEQMEAAGIVTSANHVGKRDIIIEDIG